MYAVSKEYLLYHRSSSLLLAINQEAPPISQILYVAIVLSTRLLYRKQGCVPSREVLVQESLLQQPVNVRFNTFSSLQRYRVLVQQDGISLGLKLHIHMGLQACMSYLAWLFQLKQEGTFLVTKHYPVFWVLVSNKLYSSSSLIVRTWTGSPAGPLN